MFGIFLKNVFCCYNTDISAQLKNTWTECCFDIFCHWTWLKFNHTSLTMVHRILLNIKLSKHVVLQVMFKDGLGGPGSAATPGSSLDLLQGTTTTPTADTRCISLLLKLNLKRWGQVRDLQTRKWSETNPSDWRSVTFYCSKGLEQYSSNKLCK